MGVFKRSRLVFAASFDVVKKDKELLWFPILAAIASIAWFLALFFPTVMLGLINEGDSFVMETMEWIITALTYFGLAFIRTFFDFCTVYTIKTRFEGGNSTLGQAFKYTFSKFHYVFVWALINAIVGVIMNVLDNAAQQMGDAGRIILGIIRWIASIAWSILSMFVIPAMVYYDMGPGKAMKKSGQVFTKTWGENLVRSFGLFIFWLMLALLSAGWGVLLWYLTANLILTILVPLIIFAIGGLILSTVNKVYDVALFVYAETGRIPGTYDQNVIKNAFKPRKIRA